MFGVGNVSASVKYLYIRLKVGQILNHMMFTLSSLMIDQLTECLNCSKRLAQNEFLVNKHDGRYACVITYIVMLTQ